ncbi:hypothetical protein M513_13082 [Trichuris suis]|uniref:Uncharacterized protein n=1 Tax=Trichuris suis TaxID=68888 RepID=A0A085LM46_9BILA|nr:hypothetical protein M513_13082 [Trichuris suis]
MSKNPSSPFRPYSVESGFTRVASSRKPSKVMDAAEPGAVRVLLSSLEPDTMEVAEKRQAQRWN